VAARAPGAAWFRRDAAPQPRPLPADLARRLQHRTGVAVVLIAIVVLWMAAALPVLPDEVGVVLRFGGYNAPPSPGSTTICRPDRERATPSVTRVNRTEIDTARARAAPQARANCRKKR
jgi:hypothetical protein